MKTKLKDLGLTLVHPFCGEEERFKRLFANWLTWSDEVKDNLNISIVDDYGTPSVEDMLTPSVVKRCNLNLTVYRILDDLWHNTPGGLNLGCMTAATPWILTMDSDCTFEGEEMQKLMEMEPKRNEVYSFFRKRITNEAKWAWNQRVLPCTILMHKDTFLNINGFDEDFTGEWSGGYGMFDNAFHDRCLVAGYKLVKQPGILATEWMADVVGPPVEMTYEQRAYNKHIWRKKQRGEVPFSKHMLRFNWKIAKQFLRTK